MCLHRYAALVYVNAQSVGKPSVTLVVVRIALVFAVGVGTVSGTILMCASNSKNGLSHAERTYY